MNPSPPCPRQVEGLKLEETAEGYVIRSGNTTHHLNRSAALILAMCTGDLGLDEIHAALSEIGGLSATPKDQLARCLQQLQKRGLINVPDPGAEDGPR